MKRVVAIPLKYLAPGTNAVREDLTPEEKADAAQYGEFPLTEEEIAARQAEAEQAEAEAAAREAEMQATEYRRLRAAEYPPVGDQLDAIMKWLATETEFGIPAELKSLAMTCMSVKSKYPKPDSN